MAALTGDSHAHLLPVLERGASEAGYAVERREEMPSRAEGFVDHERRLIAVSSTLEPNGQVAVLVHELAHVHGARYQDFGRAGAEVVAETAAHIALSAARLDSRAQSVPYVAGWADAAPKELAGYADAVHRIAAILERGLEIGEMLRERPLSRIDERLAPSIRSLGVASRDSTPRTR